MRQVILVGGYKLQVDDSGTETTVAMWHEGRYLGEGRLRAFGLEDLDDIPGGIPPADLAKIEKALGVDA